MKRVLFVVSLLPLLVVAHVVVARHAACPFGFDRAGHRAPGHGAPAATRPALGFALDHTTAADLQRWATGLDCTTRGPRITCAHVPAARLPTAAGLDLDSLAFDLADDGTLIAIRALRRTANPATIAADFAGVERDLTTHAGPPAARTGLATALDAPLRQASIEYRFADYRATVRATRLGAGFVLTEDYAALAGS